MNQSTTSDNSALQTLIPKLLWAGVFPSLLIYIFIAHQSTTQPDRVSMENNDITLLVTVFTLMSALFFVLVLKLKSQISSQSVRLALVNGGKLPLLIKLMSSFKGTKDHEKTFFGTLFHIYLMIWGIGHSIAIYGFMLTTISGDILYVAIFAVVSALLHCFTFPSTELPTAE